MKKIFYTLIVICCSYVLPAHAQDDHPIRLGDFAIEANEFMLFSTNGSSGSAVSTKSVVGYYNRTPNTPTSSRIVEAYSQTNGSNLNSAGDKMMNSIALDYNGDGYDQPVIMYQRELGGNQYLWLSFPDIDQGTLGINSIDLNPTQGVMQVDANNPSPIIKSAKGDFNDDGKEELVIVYSFNSQLTVALIHPTPYNQGARYNILGSVKIGAFQPLKADDFQTFDVAVGDYDNDGKADIAVAGFEHWDVNPIWRNVFVQLTEVNPSANYNAWTWTLDNRGRGVSGPGTQNTNSAWENLALTTFKNKQGVDQLAVATSFYNQQSSSPGFGNTSRYIWPVLTYWRHYLEDNDSYGLDTVAFLPDRHYHQNGFTKEAVDLVAGDLNGDGSDEIIVAWDNEVEVFDFSFRSGAQPSWDIFRKATATGPSIQNQFYELVYGGDYLQVGDVDYDNKEDIFMFTTDDDGSSGNAQQTLRLNVWGTDPGLNSLNLKANESFLPTSWNGQSDSYHFCAAMGDFRGARAVLKDPVKYTRTLTTPMVVNNGPPHHFDIINGTTHDILDVWPTWPTTNASGKLEAIYAKTSSQTNTVESTVSNDWSASTEVTAGGSFFKVGVEGKIKATYGEGFSKTANSSEMVRISTEALAKGDDQLFALIQDYDFYEYAIDSSGITIGNIVAMIRTGTPLITWTLSKLNDAAGYLPTHEPGNILSYPSLADFDIYNGVIERVYTAPSGYTFAGGAGNTVTHSVKHETFMSNSASESMSFGASIGATVGYKGVQVAVEGNYGQNSLNTHSSQVSKDVSFTYTMDRALDPNYTDASYTIYPIVYWGDNGALNLDYAVEPSIANQGGTTFWSDRYANKPDLSLILPWKYEPEKGQNLGNTADRRRQCKSILLNKEEFVPGETVKITAIIQNYSLKDYTGPVEFLFYEGNPDQGGTLLSDVNGNTSLSLNQTFAARSRTPITFDWLVPQGTAVKPVIYVVIDPENSVSEIHENNNVGWIATGFAPIVSNRDELETISFQSRLFPNPATSDQIQIEFMLPDAAEIEIDIVNLQGQTVRNISKRPLGPGNYIVPADLKALPRGYYLVRIRSGRHQENLKLVRG